MNGKSIEDIVKSVEDRKNKDFVVFIPENLTALKNGGRISPAIAAIGNTIGIKPVINLIDGRLEKSEMTRKVKQTFIESAKKSIELYPASDYDYAFVGFDANEMTFNYLYEQIQSIVGEQKILTGVLPINVCAHCGPGTMGLLVTKKINGKSLNEFI
jgi:fatty acid-binding protein DegV